jgi:glucosylceramidase
VMPQNEPNISSNYTSCLWTGEQLAKFIGNHLGPTLRGAGLKTNIWLGTLNESSRGGYAYWVGPSVQDPNVRRFLGGVGAQWDGDRDMAETHFLYPKMKLMQTESECGDTNRNDWGFADHQYGLVKKWLNAGANSFIIWNLVLDETGLSTGGWAQCSPIVIDTKRKRVTYTPYYTLFRHFSSYVKPGARLLTTASAWGDRMAFRNPDGEVVVVMANTDAHDQTVTLNVDGVASGAISLPAHSFNTFTLRGH